MGVLLGPILTCCHPITGYVWVMNALVSTSASHSGYGMLNADYHDQHHQFFDYNYGVGNMIDNLLKTEWVGSEKWKKLQAREEKKSK